jgi:hypothetical protein
MPRQTRELKVNIHLRSEDTSFVYPQPRAVYIFRRPCIQTFSSPGLQYLNLLLRTIEHRLTLCHWGVMVSTEHPPNRKSGSVYKLKQPVRQTSSSFELEAPNMRPDGDDGTVGSLEKCFPTQKHRSKTLLYIGQTTLTDEDISLLADSALLFIEQEGHYHGVYRNCQHFANMLVGLLCPESRCPRSCDEICWRAMWLFKGRKLKMGARIEGLKLLHERRLSEKERLAEKSVEAA